MVHARDVVLLCMSTSGADQPHHAPTSPLHHGAGMIQIVQKVISGCMIAKHLNNWNS